jgi:hypothetical protein
MLDLLHGFNPHKIVVLALLHSKSLHNPTLPRRPERKKALSDRAGFRDPGGARRLGLFPTLETTAPPFSLISAARAAHDGSG